ncbi:hypothetical protein [Aromatoleum diolicum]|uniref:Uncharacterized protein n=1 Tax=Aromatoleum diolicum TaxID=75796 RepID=A0ABX1QI36_9RHOO|nr:hypothetical protein [Aromatoleum diolicum]NMG77102.1 hypothetical protein [Aromatoleum diolicum]
MIKLVLLGALCAFLGSLWLKGGTKTPSVVSCLEHHDSCHGEMLAAHASVGQVFAPLAIR